MNTQLDTRYRSPMQEKLHAYNEALLREIEAREQGKPDERLTEARKRAYAEARQAQEDYLSGLK